ncbi:hypothetical protein [Microbacterium sp.]|uniref:hypothetical protein n=1 Tax=Microbacterium sp. TaxID=51671 RepID=UPI0039E507FC
MSSLWGGRKAPASTPCRSPTTRSPSRTWCYATPADGWISIPRSEIVCRVA